MSVFTTGTVRHVVGPYESWILGAGRAYDFAQLYPRSVPADLRFSGVMQNRRLASGQIVKVKNGDGTKTRAIAPTIWSGSDSSYAPVLLVAIPDLAGFGTLQAPQDATFRAGYPLLPDTCDDSFDGTTAGTEIDPTVDATKPIVIVACIDDGIPFANRAFGDRIDYCWTQSGLSRGDGTVLFGREFTGSQTAGLKIAHGGDEDALYAAAGVQGGGVRPNGPLTRAVSHGGHVMDLLTGGVDDPQVRVIAVDLPTAATWDTSGFGKGAFVLSAMHYIFDRAERIAAAYGTGPLPVVINLSYGTSGGPHDGTAQIEAAMDNLIEARRSQAPTALVMPSGNQHLDRMHAACAFTGETTLNWRVQPCDRTSSFVELWLPQGADASAYDIDLIAPNGDITATLKGGSAPLMVKPIRKDAQTIGELSLENRNARARFLVALAPTEMLQGHLPTAQGGKWQIKLRRDAGQTGRVMAWIQRDIDYGGGETGARQSYFDDPANPLFDDKGNIRTDDNSMSNIRRYGSFNGMASGRTSLVVGGTVETTAKGDSLRATVFSSTGPQTDAGNMTVDASAVCDASTISLGLRASGTRSGAQAVLRGTSMAAPQVARALATAFLSTSNSFAAGFSASNYKELLSSDPKWRPMPIPNQQRLGAGEIGRTPTNLPPSG
jgi:hypothetical protein